MEKEEILKMMTVDDIDEIIEKLEDNVDSDINMMLNTVETFDNIMDSKGSQYWINDSTTDQFMLNNYKHILESLNRNNKTEFLLELIETIKDAAEMDRELNRNLRNISSSLRDKILDAIMYYDEHVSSEYSPVVIDKSYEDNIDSKDITNILRSIIRQYIDHEDLKIFVDKKKETKLEFKFEDIEKKLEEIYRRLKN